MARPSKPATSREPVSRPGVGAVFEEMSHRITRGGEQLDEAALEDIRTAGSRAAEQGMTASAAVDLFLTSAAQAWGLVSSRDQKDAQVSAQTVLTGMRAAVPALVEGYQNAGQQLIRQDETVRREFIDDLLRGDADVAGIVQRAEPFGIDLTAWHQIVLAGPRNDARVDELDSTVLEREVLGRYGDRDVLVTTKGGYLVALVPASPANLDVDEPARLLHKELSRSTRRKQWRVAVGRPYPGVHGVARSYEQAREAMTLAERLHPDEAMVQTRDLLIYRVLGRDRVALAELVESVLTPLTMARGGAGPLVDTLEAYFESGEVNTATARRLHVSVRTVTYRLAKIASLTGYDPTVPAQRLTLQASVVGARLLPWPPETPVAITD
ncbi:MAG TPA: helix-turn-helix domain-containing protein [Propionicimonas sp.]|nr:helix-turn-helix domain-containing protein [Propionicimonas sp.]